MTKPEPVAWLHIEPGWGVSVEDEDEADGCPHCQPVYTADALAAAHDAALEKAAKWFLEKDNQRMFHSEMLYPHEVAKRLRLLKEKRDE